MYKTEKLKALVNERLKAAAEEIFSLFEKTIQDYQEEVFRSKQEIDSRRRLVGCKAPLQLSVQEDDASPEQNAQQPAQIKEEHEELWTNQAGEMLQEDDTKDSLFNVIYMERSDEYGRWYSHSNQNIESVEGDPLPSTSARQKAEPDPEYYAAPELTSDYQMINDVDSDDCRGSGGHHSGTKRNEQQRAAPLQRSIQEEEAASEQEHCDSKIGLGEDDQEAQLVNEHDKLWTNQSGEKLQEDDTKDSLFNIPYMRRHDEEARSCSYSNQISENIGDPLPSSSTEHKAEPEQCCGDPELTGDYQMGENVDQRGSEGQQSGTAKNKQQPGKTVARLYACSFCNKTFRTKFILANHVTIHTEAKLYSCRICGKRFLYRTHLQLHMNCHSGQRPYTCNICGKGFTHPGSISTHKRTHTGEKPYSCADCGKHFRQKADLIKHTLIHTGEKPFRCNVCNREFNRLSNCRRHMRTHLV
ncbi:zinc finger protein 567-like isoform X2 [Thalassophryne amazonica]|uniref:zinc finger protein 567-like isoform X2 n=1 Tax=Thalassophryne amazonica TaxID=390379 RepID=UPI001471870F|nr:zinc finger protein 567-like isoform X2 [Thalassophryne amazonica]